MRESYSLAKDRVSLGPSVLSFSALPSVHTLFLPTHPICKVTVLACAAYPYQNRLGFYIPPVISRAAPALHIRLPQGPHYAQLLTTSPSQTLLLEGPGRTWPSPCVSDEDADAEGAAHLSKATQLTHGGAEPGPRPVAHISGEVIFWCPSDRLCAISVPQLFGRVGVVPERDVGGSYPSPGHFPCLRREITGAGAEPWVFLSP